MASLNMVGPYRLTDDEINANIESDKIGNYAFGYLNDKGAFVVRYVGRSDTDLRTRIKHGLADRRTNPKMWQYEYFKFSYADTSTEAYIKECKNYHDFGGDRGNLLNTSHPDVPNGLEIYCPFCNV
ncbi:hypothetical protein AB9N12_01355 [Bacteroides sp. AN502(2024)]|uniref:hypothetical protein n=1 Tax=Bacteroides sp. AN502(2024) TaxID=3160599 RepID=UPI0035155341